VYGQLSVVRWQQALPSWQLYAPGRWEKICQEFEPGVFSLAHTPSLGNGEGPYSVYAASVINVAMVETRNYNVSKSIGTYDLERDYKKYQTLTFPAHEGV
jgi:hypothetical protein